MIFHGVINTYSILSASVTASGADATLSLLSAGFQLHFAPADKGTIATAEATRTNATEQTKLILVCSF